MLPKKKRTYPESRHWQRACGPRVTMQRRLERETKDVSSSPACGGLEVAAWRVERRSRGSIHDQDMVFAQPLPERAHRPFSLS